LLTDFCTIWGRDLTRYIEQLARWWVAPEFAGSPLYQFDFSPIIRAETIWNISELFSIVVCCWLRRVVSQYENCEDLQMTSIYLATRHSLHSSLPPTVCG